MEMKRMFWTAPCSMLGARGFRIPGFRIPNSVWGMGRRGVRGIARHERVGHGVSHLVGHWVS